MYTESRIGGPPELNKMVAIDDCLFIHDNNTPIWVIVELKQTVEK